MNIPCAKYRWKGNGWKWSIGTAEFKHRGRFYRQFRTLRINIPNQNGVIHATARHKFSIRTKVTTQNLKQSINHLKWRTGLPGQKACLRSIFNLYNIFISFTSSRCPCRPPSMKAMTSDHTSQIRIVWSFEADAKILRWMGWKCSSLMEEPCPIKWRTI